MLMGLEGGLECSVLNRQMTQSRRMMSLLVHVHAPHSHAVISEDSEAGRGFVASDEGVVEFPCHCWGWGGTVTAPSVAIQWVFTIINM